MCHALLVKASRANVRLTIFHNELIWCACVFQDLTDQFPLDGAGVVEIPSALFHKHPRLALRLLSTSARCPDTLKPTAIAVVLLSSRNIPSIACCTCWDFCGFVGSDPKVAFPGFLKLAAAESLRSFRCDPFRFSNETR